MLTYISMLRGINVTGHKIIKMAELKAVYESLGFEAVTTYIQSGNVIFASGTTDVDDVRATIVAGIRKKFGYDVTVILRKPDELKSVIRKNPYLSRRGVDETRLYVTFLESKPAPALVKSIVPLTAKSKDEYAVLGREVYLYCPHGYGETLLSNTFFEKNLKSAATTRNWNTVNKLLSLGSGEHP